MSRGFILSAPASGSGKTVVTLGLLRAFRDAGAAVRAAKSGPDYIDPAWHRRASGGPSVNLDAWAMGPELIRSLAAGAGLLVVEGAMGLFDGAPPDGRGATADLAEILHLPVVLVLDCAAMGHSVAALVRGFRGHRPGVEIAGVILNRTGSDRHEALLRRALGEVAVLGVWRRDAALALPSRHLGLTLPDGGAEAFLAAAGARAAAGLDLAALAALARPLPPAGPQGPALPPPGKVIALARDAAFAFAYDHVIAGWRRAGSAVREFSPLAGEAPAAEADAVILPGGYPELFAADLAAAKGFRQGMEAARDRGALIDGECGGYMVLGRGLTDADGRRHEMLGFLRLETSFAARKLHLGYRTLIAKDGRFCGHEFHYATTLKAEGEPLFQARNAEGEDLAPMGLRQGNVRGSFAHRIAVAGGK